MDNLLFSFPINKNDIYLCDTKLQMKTTDYVVFSNCSKKDYYFHIIFYLHNVKFNLYEENLFEKIKAVKLKAFYNKEGFNKNDENERKQKEQKEDSVIAKFTKAYGFDEDDSDLFLTFYTFKTILWLLRNPTESILPIRFPYFFQYDYEIFDLPHDHLYNYIRILKFYTFTFSFISQYVYGIFNYFSVVPFYFLFFWKRFFAYFQKYNIYGYYPFYITNDLEYHKIYMNYYKYKAKLRAKGKRTDFVKSSEFEVYNISRINFIPKYKDIVDYLRNLQLNYKNVNPIGYGKKFSKLEKKISTTRFYTLRQLKPDFVEIEKRNEKKIRYLRINKNYTEYTNFLKKLSYFTYFLKDFKKICRN